MIVNLNRDVVNNLYVGTITTEADSLDANYIKNYGEPTVPTDGTITYTKPDLTTSTFALAGMPAMPVMSGSGFQFKLSSNSDAEAVNKVDGWLATVGARIQSAMTTLRTKPLLVGPTITVLRA